MANEFKVKKGLIVQGSGSTGDTTILDVQGNQGQLFSITDSLSGSLFSVGDISGIPVLEVFSDETVKIGTFGSEGLIINGSNVTSSGNISASGTITGNSFVGSFTGAVTGDATGLTGTPSISVTNITASGDISSSGDIELGGNINLHGGGTIEAPSVNGGEDLIFKAAGGMDFEIDSNGNSAEDQAFRIFKHSIGGPPLF